MIICVKNTKTITRYEKELPGRWGECPREPDCADSSLDGQLPSFRRAPAEADDSQIHTHRTRTIPLPRGEGQGEGQTGTSVFTVLTERRKQELTEYCANPPLLLIRSELPPPNGKPTQN